jgi:hypothetical protein
MNRTKVITFLIIALAFAASQICPESVGDDFKLVTGVLDESGGAAESGNFKIRGYSGGQPSPVGVGTSSNFEVRAGYMHSAAVLHGDANADGIVSLADVVYIANYLFKSGPPPIPLEAGDVNCDGLVSVADAVYLSNYLLKSGDPPCDPPV